MKKVFIGGCDRSGTTFLAGLLAQHSGVLMPPESQFKRDVNLSDLDKFNVEEHKKILLESWRFKNWFDNVEFLNNISNDCTYQEFYEALVSKYSLDTYGTSKVEFWVDHTPENLEYFPMFDSLFDDLSYIHIVRDGRAVSASIKGLEWGPNTPKSMADFWIEKLSYGFACEASSINKVLRVKYEDLVQNTEVELARIIKFIKLKSEVENGKKIKLPGFTQNQHSLVGKKPNASRVNRWMDQLSDFEINTFEYYTHSMLHILGYKPKQEYYYSPSKLLLFRDILIEIIKKQMNKISYEKARRIK